MLGPERALSCDERALEQRPGRLVATLPHVRDAEIVDGGRDEAFVHPAHSLRRLQNGLVQRPRLGEVTRALKGVGEIASADGDAFVVRAERCFEHCDRLTMDGLSLIEARLKLSQKSDVL